MDVAKLNAQGVMAFMHLISPDVAAEIKNSIKKNPDSSNIGDGFVVYGAYNEELMIPQGVLVVQVAGTSVFIRSLFVDPLHRDFGAAGKMTDDLIYDALVTDDIAEIEFLAMTERPEQMEIADFLHSRGFICEEAEERSYTTILSRIMENGRLSKASGKGAVALKDVPDRVLRDLGNKLADDEDVFIELPIKKEDYDQDVSTIVIKDDVVTDIVLVEKERRGLNISYVRSMDEGAGILSAIAASMRNAAEKYRPDMPVSIPVVTEEGKKLANHIVSDAYENRFVRCYYSLLPLCRLTYGREMEL